MIFWYQENALTPEKQALYILEKNENLLTKFGLALGKSSI